MISVISGFGWPAVARIAVVGGVALSVWLAFQWFTGVLDENLQLQVENADLQSNLDVEKSARERANRAAKLARENHESVAAEFRRYRQQQETPINEEHKAWRDRPLPAGLVDRLQHYADPEGNSGNQGAGGQDGEDSSTPADR